jgi:hypothetical protein
MKSSIALPRSDIERAAAGAPVRAAAETMTTRVAT